MLPMERHKAVAAAAQNAQKCDVYMHEIVPSSIDCLKKATAAGQEVLQMTDTQRRVLLLVNELVSAQDWKGILARENEFRATAVALQAAGRSLTLSLPANARTRLTCPPHSHGQIRPTPMPSTRISDWHMRCLMSRSSEPSSRHETRQGRLGSSDSAAVALCMHSRARAGANHMHLLFTPHHLTSTPTAAVPDTTVPGTQSFPHCPPRLSSLRSPCPHPTDRLCRLNHSRAILHLS